MSKRNLKHLEIPQHTLPPFTFVPDRKTDRQIAEGKCDNIPRIQEFIHRRRRQMIIHSVIYYRMDDSIISDYTWQDWANELRDVQNRWPELKAMGYHDDLFEEWDGSTGMHLDLVQYYSQAQRILGYHREKHGELLL
ncbi:putative DNA ligase [Erwinia phage pEa_SNUABM_8]|nr:putative DNA ligase [Erwinia phage pEa_SNUABM_8]QVW54834.1 hypothetical protein pEaSNUABM4_00081 [Erwinia phage pEa_SNUABM_4]